MSVKRINFTIDEELYEKVRAISFLKKKSVSEIIRYSLINFMSKDNLKVKAEELLSAEEESELLDMLKSEENQDFVTHLDLKKKYNLK